jgi:drug/metabolite transporter (DMT)-like permease
MTAGEEISPSRSATSRAGLAPYDLGLYAITVVVWTFSWLAIHYQVGPVPTEVSVVWRFALSTPLMMILAHLHGDRLNFPLSEHIRFIGLGIFLFSTSFVLFYNAAAFIASGLLCVVFSLASIVNVFLGAVVLHAPIDRRVAAAGLLGVVGVGCLFYPQVISKTVNADVLAGLGMSLVGTLCFCVGNMISARQQQRHVPIFAASAWGMLYGTILLAVIAFAVGRPFIIDPNPVYIGAVIYLAVFATVVAFACYLTMLGRIGADRAAYVTVVTPVAAMIVSSIFEDYRFTPLASVGLVAVVIGNVLVLRSRRTRDG